MINNEAPEALNTDIFKQKLYEKYQNSGKCSLKKNICQLLLKSKQLKIRKVKEHKENIIY